MMTQSEERPFGEVVAETTLLLLTSNGEEKAVRLKVGRPYLESVDGSTSWACPCEIEGLEPRYPDARGEDSYQALFLAQYLMRHRLNDILDKGGKVFMPDTRQELSKADLITFFGQ
jgi:hypothetical protein